MEAIELKYEMISELTEIVAEIEGLRGSPRGVISKRSVGGGVEEPPGGSPHGVIDVFGRGW
jgi:hypothetical protein